MITYRTAGAWGAGKGANLTAVEIDENFSDLDTRVADLESNPPEAIYPVAFEIRDGNQLYVTMSDMSELGPTEVPAGAWNFRGDWAVGLALNPLDVVQAGGAIYLVIYAHVTAGTFDAGANDGMGHDYYVKILAQPTPSRWRGEWQADEDYKQYDIFKVSTPLEYSGVYQVDLDHTSGVTFDPLAATLPSGGDYYYTMMFAFPTKRVEIAPYFFLPHTDGAVMYEFIASRVFTLPAGLTESFAKATAPATGAAVWTLTKNGVAIGTVTFSASATGAFSFAASVAFAAGDVLGFVAPDPADGGIGNIAMNIVGVLA